jgi:hypothetical protein
MTIHEFFGVVGVLIPSWKVYQHVFRTDPAFRKQIKRIYVKGNTHGFTWKEFKAFILRIEPDTAARLAEQRGQDGNAIVDEKDYDMWDTYTDSEVCELNNKKWLVEGSDSKSADEPTDNKSVSATDWELGIFRVTHDLDEDTPYVVGVRVFGHKESYDTPSSDRKTPMMGIPSEVAAQIIQAEAVVKACGFSDVRLYQLQDDCACCN